MASALVSAAILFSTAATGRTDEPNKSKDDELAARRIELMQARIASVKVTSNEEGFPVQFDSKPIFRYSDPARGYVSAAVWKLGEKGRPRALITTELHRRFQGSPRIVYEYLSLTPTRFSAAGGDVRWAPEGTALEFKLIPGTQSPEATAAQRLRQMRAVAKRFVGNELNDKERCELRLLPQPVDRYAPSSADRADGAIFLLSFGTNPEVALFIESDGKAWNYAAGRLSGAGEITLTIDGEAAWQGAPVSYGSNQPYTASNAPADIPGLSSDGKLGFPFATPATSSPHQPLCTGLSTSRETA
jgi:hypothetical protein